MSAKQKKNPKYMDECFRNEPVYELPKKKRKGVCADEELDVGV